MRHNGEVIRMRPRAVPESPQVEGRSRCRVCGEPVPRGLDRRPFCLEHGPYAQEVRRGLAATG